MAALLAACTLRALANNVEESNIDEKNEVNANADHFEQRAIALLTQCAEEAPKRAEELLIRRVHLLSNRSVFHMAGIARARSFIAHERCQSLIDRVWYGHIRETPHRSLLIFISLFCFPVLWALDYKPGKEVKLPRPVCLFSFLLPAMSLSDL